ncbi:hypothetical protein SLEP1_g13266 [Rubroshorea leprosula]|uniref:Uncharacterized protein n=1 Tax=Rubroshorea leprosula TaxID=152421 RepID=A0AAV5IL47_9ROSI|nr:hypothetical protein SLEP1_g13266 [Rubroshorea leprosula]
MGSIRPRSAAFGGNQQMGSIEPRSAGFGGTQAGFHQTQQLSSVEPSTGFHQTQLLEYPSNSNLENGKNTGKNRNSNRWAKKQLLVVMWDPFGWIWCVFARKAQNTVKSELKKEMDKTKKQGKKSTIEEGAANPSLATVETIEGNQENVVKFVY